MFTAFAAGVVIILVAAAGFRCRWALRSRRASAWEAVELLPLEPRVALCGTVSVPPVTAGVVATGPAAGPIVAENLTTPTLCAEIDNVNVPLSVSTPQSRFSFIVEARHPAYPVGDGVTAADFTNCPDMGPADGGPQQVIHLYDDHVSTALQAVRDPNFHTPGMRVRVGQRRVRDAHFIRIIRKIAGADSWPEVLVLYSDGNLRLKPQAPEGGADPVFGSSLIVGPAQRGERPVAQIYSVAYIPGKDTLRLKYAAGGSADLRILSAGRDATLLSVAARYSTSSDLPFATLRSMYVEDGNSDVDFVRWTRSGGQDAESATVGQFRLASGEAFSFGRAIWSQHNTSAPDVWVGNFKPRRR